MSGPLPLGIRKLHQRLNGGVKIIMRRPAPICARCAVIKDIWPAQDQVIGRAAWGERAAKAGKTALDCLHEVLGREHKAVQIIGMLGQCSPLGRANLNDAAGHIIEVKRRHAGIWGNWHHEGVASGRSGDGMAWIGGHGTGWGGGGQNHRESQATKIKSLL